METLEDILFHSSNLEHMTMKNCDIYIELIRHVYYIKIYDIQEGGKHNIQLQNNKTYFPWESQH